MDEPVKPDDSDCCSSGCKPCVFDVYEDQLKKWKSNQSIIQSRALNQTKYLPFLVSDIQSKGNLLTFTFQSVELLKNQNCMYLQNTQPEIDYQVLHDFLNIKSGEYLIMKGVHDTEAISRSYTPVLDPENFENGTFTVIISLQPEGKMSQFLSKLKTNDIVFWRGPYQEFTYRPNSYKSILLIGGGTGVIPLYNIAKNIVENDKDDTWVNVVACFKSIDCIILRNEFRRLKDFWNFKSVFYISNQNDSNFKSSYNEIIYFNRINETAIGEELKSYDRGEIFVVVCGPEGFNHFVKECLIKHGIDNDNIFIFWYVCNIFVKNIPLFVT